MSTCDITPISAFQSTNLNSKIDSFGRLGDRVLRSLGYPFINVEIHRDTLYENISIACEMFAKFAGYTQEYLLFDSNLYVKNQGIRLDHLFSLNESDTFKEQVAFNNKSEDFSNYIDESETLYISTSAIPGTYFATTSSLSAELQDGIFANQIFSQDMYSVIFVALSAGLTSSVTTYDLTGVYSPGGTPIPNDGTYTILLSSGQTTQIEVVSSYITSFTTVTGSSTNETSATAILSSDNNITVDIGLAWEAQTLTTTAPTLSSLFTTSHKHNFTQSGNITGKRDKFMNSFDYDLMDYRKVISVQDFEEGSSTGINTLFSIEQTMAQQTYFSYAMGNYGFDLISWYVLKDWMEMREKLLATKRSYTFDDRTQMLRMYPQPRSGSGSSSRFYGVVSCYVERPIRDIIKEHWVYQYTLALTKIAVANIRGKYGTVTLFGGGSLNSSDLMTQGLSEKEKLEASLYEGAPGLGDAEPPMFFVG